MKTELEMEAGGDYVDRLVREFLDLRRMDCMELMAGYPDKHFDLAIVDPPYGIGEIGQSEKRVKYGKYKWNQNIPTVAYFEELMRVTKRRIVWGANYYNSFEGGKAAIIWDKQMPHPNLSHAEIASYSEGQRVVVFRYSHQVFAANVNGANRIHPCQKPVELYDWLLEKYAKPGDLILDTHLGSGSIAIACYYARLHLTACEIDEDYFKAACARIERETAQVSFDFSNAGLSHGDGSATPTHQKL